MSRLVQGPSETPLWEAIRASGSALGDASTVLLAQDTGALATLLSGSQGANIASVVNGV